MARGLISPHPVLTPRKLHKTLFFCKPTISPLYNAMFTLNWHGVRLLPCNPFSSKLFKKRRIMWNFHWSYLRLLLARITTKILKEIRRNIQLHCYFSPSTFGPVESRIILCVYLFFLSYNPVICMPIISHFYWAINYIFSRSFAGFAGPSVCFSLSSEL